MKKFALALLISALILAILVPALSENIPLELNLNSITIGAGQSVKTVKVTSGHTDVTWSSSDEKIATVDETGKIKGVKKGTAIITAASDGQTAEVTVTVVKKDKGVKKIKLNKKTADIEQGKSVKLKATLTPAKPKDKTITWLSSDETIATVNSKGKITAVAPGKATITAISSSGKSAKCEVTVTGILVEKIELRGDSNIVAGQKTQFLAVITPENAAIQTLKWKSSDNKIATVDQNGIVTAKKKGKVTITATAKDGSKVKGKKKITVEAPAGFKYRDYGDGVQLYQYKGADKNLVIPDIVNGKKVVSIDSFVFLDDMLIETVTLPKYLKEIGMEAFRNCDALKEIYIPDSVNYLGSNAFEGCASLKTISLSGAFRRFENGSVVGRYVFANCPSLETVELRDGMNYLGEHMFYNCTALTQVIMPDTVTNIVLSTFEGCTALESIKLSSALEIIEENSFAGCTSLKSVVIPDSVVNIGKNAFAGCKSIETVDLGNGNLTIYNSAFQGCSSLSELYIPERTRIYSQCFYGCTSLKQVTYGVGVGFGNQIFAGCTSLDSFTFNEDSDALANGMFEGCTALKTVEFKGPVQYLGSYAFKDCTSLVNIDLPDELLYVHDGVFMGCTSLKSIKFPKDLWTIDADVFNGCTSLESVDFGGVFGTGARAFKGCTSLREITIPDMFSVIIDNMFEGCTSLEKVTLGANITTICSDAFKNVHPNFTIYGVSGSYAEKYARDNNIPFVPVTK